MNNKELTKKTQEIKEILNNHIEFGGEETPNYHRIVGYNELVATLADYIIKTTQSNDDIKREALQEFRKWFREWEPTFPNSEPESVLMAKGYNLCLHEMGWKAKGYLTQQSLDKEIKENNE